MDTIVNFVEENDLILTALQNHLVLYTDDNREKERHMIIKTLYQHLNYKGVSFKRNLQIIQQHNINYKQKQK